MLLSKYSYHKKKKSPLKILLLIFIILLLITGLTVFFIFLFNQNSETVLQQNNENERNITELWSDGLYSEVISKSKLLLNVNPVDSVTLMYSGFSYYFLAYYEKKLEEKINLVDRAIIDIRRAKLDLNLAYKAETDYILGKAYIEKEVIFQDEERVYAGKFYPDLAVKYLESSIERGYTGKDTYEYLGLAYDALGNQKMVIDSFEKAYEIEKLDKYSLAIGKAYLILEDFENAEQYLLRTLSETENPDTEKESRFALGEVYLSRNDLENAKNQYLEIIEIDPVSAEAHYQLGEIYLANNDIVEARAEFRKTLVINPNHYGARLRYYN